MSRLKCLLVSDVSIWCNWTIMKLWNISALQVLHEALVCLTSAQNWPFYFSACKYRFLLFFFLIEINRVYTNLTVLSTVTHICLLFSMISEGDETTQRHMHLCVYTRKKMMPCRGFWTQRGIFTELHSGAEVSGDWSSYKIYENKQWEGGQRGREWKQVH